MPMSPRLLRPRAGGLHPEAADWRARVVANSGTVNTATVQAVDRFCRSIDANGLRSLIWRLNPMAGDNLSAALVPLYRATSASGAVQGNATDENDNFVSGDYAATSGLIGNGSNKRLRTGVPLNFTTNRHLGCFVHTLPTATFRSYVGGTGASTFAGLFRISNTSPVTGYTLVNYTDASGAGGPAAGTHAAGDFVLGTHGTGASTAFNYTNGVQSGNSGAGQAAGSVTTALSVFAEAQGAGTFSSHSNARIGGYTIGDNLSASQAATYYTIWDTLLRALGRK